MGIFGCWNLLNISFGWIVVGNVMVNCLIVVGNVNELVWIVLCILVMVVVWIVLCIVMDVDGIVQA